MSSPDRQPFLTACQIAPLTGVAKAQQSRPEITQTCGAPTEQLNSSAVGIKGKARQNTPGGGVA